MAFITVLFDFIWRLFSLPWPGMPFTFGQAFLAAILSSGSLAILLKLFGVGVPHFTFGGNNRNIHVSDNRKGDEK